MTYILEIDGQPRLVGIQVAKFLQAMAEEKVVYLKPYLASKTAHWRGETADGRMVDLRPTTEEDIT